MAGRNNSYPLPKANVPRRPTSSTKDCESDLSFQSMPCDYGIFDRSTTPMDYTEEGDDTLWPVKGIITEETDLTERSIYQVDWSPWLRPDGTTTTWETVLPGPNTILRNWKGIQTRKRRQMASEGPEIDLDTIGSYMPHNIRTAENACAYLEKLRLWHPVFEDIQVDNKMRTENKSHTGSAEHSIPSSTVAKFVIDTDELVLRSSAVASSGQLFATSETIWDIESRWNAAALDEGAASIRIINEIDGELPVGPDFVYLEASREYAEGVQPPDPSFLVSCDCKDGCRNPLLCSCLAESHCRDENDNPCPAYDKKGHFLFSNLREVIECNRNCTCKNCNNNVAQRPRKVPLEIFKARNNGWGVRPTVFVPCGTVFGVFTGALIKRNVLNNSELEESRYDFDLDTRDDDPEFKNVPKYATSALSSGNWSRFINHSCVPTAIVYSVVIDTSIRDNMPYIAFVACADIPARKELTIDYNPRGIITATKRKKRGKGKIKSNGTSCVCGSELCRGFI